MSILWPELNHPSLPVGDIPVSQFVRDLCDYAATLNCPQKVLQFRMSPLKVEIFNFGSFDIPVTVAVSGLGGVLGFSNFLTRAEQSKQKFLDACTGRQLHDYHLKQEKIFLWPGKQVSHWHSAN